MTIIKGNFFDVRRFTLHDGDGLRTTFFLKGCPLKCVWCQNPEGIEPEAVPMYFSSRCCECNICLRHGVIEFEQGKRIISDNWRTNWDQAGADCPTGALVLCGGTYTVAEAVALAVKDRVFYREGGGVTLSGGEPLAQVKFCLEFLQALQAEGINTAMESSLYVQTEVLEQVLPHLDFLYADLKIFDNTKHRLYTGVDNTLIKENIKIALRRLGSERVIIRTPLIPSFTADRDNIMAIAGFLAGCDENVRYELLNYNPLAEAKYNHLGKKFCLDGCVPYTDGQMSEIRLWARQQGIKFIVE